MTVVLRAAPFLLCGLLLAACGREPALRADEIYGRGGQTYWIDVGDGKLKAEIYSAATVSARPALVVVLHGDLFNPTPSYQYAFAQALTQGFDAPAMPERVRARLGAHPGMSDALAAGFLRPGYTDNSGDRSDGERGNATGDNFTLEVIDAVARAALSIEEQFMARRLVFVGHSGGGTIVANRAGAASRTSSMRRCWWRAAAAGHEAFSRSIWQLASGPA